MELPLRLQALQLAAAFALGAALGVVYDLLRALRRRVPALTAAADALFCLLLLVGLLALALYAGGGLLRLFFFPGIALGAWAYFLTLGRLLLPAFSWVFSAIGRVFHLILAPGKIFLKKSEKKIDFIGPCRYNVFLHETVSVSIFTLLEEV